MRIISGDWRGRAIVAPKGDTTRPSADRTRETLFSMLVSRLGSFEGLAIADLFAGSGALGLEALSRGAVSCQFVEHDRDALAALDRNIAKLGAAPRARVVRQSVLALPAQPAPLDLVMMDPPYTTGAGAVALDRLSRFGWFGPASWIAVETARSENVDVAGFAIDTVRDVGRARLHLLRQA